MAPGGRAWQRAQPPPQSLTRRSPRPSHHRCPALAMSSTTMSRSAPPPSAQEVTRKLSMHSKPPPKVRLPYRAGIARARTVPMFLYILCSPPRLSRGPLRIHTRKRKLYPIESQTRSLSCPQTCPIMSRTLRSRSLPVPRCTPPCLPSLSGGTGAGRNQRKMRMRARGAGGRPITRRASGARMTKQCSCQATYGRRARGER